MSERRRRSLLVGAAVTSAMAAGVMLAATWHGRPDRTLLLWTVLCLIGEALWVRLPLGGATLSMAITFDFAAMLLLPPGHALAAIAASTVIGEAAFMRKRPLRILFNASQSVLAAGAGIAAWRWLGGYLPGGAFGAGASVACAAAAVAYTAINTVMVSAMIALERDIPLSRVWRVNFGNGYEVLSNGALFSMGALLAMVAGRLGGEVVALFALPLLLVWISYRNLLARSSARAAEAEGGGRAAA